ncbi:hypothetical protein MIMGU_mgv1a022136mg [Erythranthe guttata]|uniref:Pectinesterase inhibitor domain-containing protein n=1 Tax=Erythranthe guttata TaxID=4155 RepID=A0A022RIC9_ERYGU|nr:PREDICTED: pectinesterase inhibitor 2-like [Erythranthe guttata]EYU40187.1 hypothetical protein MIMGU_mgv1a022136mg [Erythranthe guttata]|eukprot:XP_012834075.1 PREDICTED: pectinesterase inhibitor 2-like [Erythranthe guttata]
MESPNALSFILKLMLVFYLLNIAANNVNYGSAANTKPKINLISAICPKTSNPKKCLFLLNVNSSTRGAPTLRDLGVVTLGISINKANTSIRSINNSLRFVDKPPTKQIYEACIDKFKSSIDMLSEAKQMVTANNFAPARKVLEQVVHVPSTCQKELAKAGPPTVVRLANAISDWFFDIAFVIVKELEAGKN